MRGATNFQIFNFAHLITLLIIILIACILVLLARSKRFNSWIRSISGTLAIILLGNELIGFIIAIKLGLWSLEWGLPLQICDLAIFAVVYSLIRHKQFIWEIAYFWGLSGTLQAVLTPDIQFNFPDYFFFKFFITHGGIVIAVIFLAAGCQRRISRTSIWRVWLVTNVYALFIGIFNQIFKTNYLYLCEKPHQSSLLDYLGPWPFYLLSLQAVFLISLFLYYSPFFIIEKINQCKHKK